MKKLSIIVYCYCIIECPIICKTALRHIAASKALGGNKKKVTTLMAIPDIIDTFTQIFLLFIMEVDDLRTRLWNSNLKTKLCKLCFLLKE